MQKKRDLNVENSCVKSNLTHTHNCLMTLSFQIGGRDAFKTLQLRTENMYI